MDRGNDRGNATPQVDLENFRRKWKEELGLGISNVRPANTTTEDKRNLNVVSLDQKPDSNANVEENHSSIEDEAHELFLQGVQLEKSRQYFDAIKYYKKALNLVPDIEYRFYKLQQQQQAAVTEQRRNSSPKRKVRENTPTAESYDDLDTDFEDLESKFLFDVEQNNWTWFEKNKEDDKFHFKDLPEEVVKYLLRWVVSKDVDVRSLESLGCVSKGFFVVSRDEQLWKDICTRTWKHVKNRPPEFTSYREMYLRRPRVRFDGCYISKISYIRAGENSFQDQSYRPWHIVEYYRYLRFNANGTVYFLTSSEGPLGVIPSLRDPRNQTKFPGMLVGSYYYSLDGEHVYGQCWNPLKGKQKQKSNNVTYNFVFKIYHTKKRFNVGLTWTEYYLNFQTSTGVLKNEFRMDPLKFPNFIYSRVKSFNRESRDVLTCTKE